MNQHQQKKATGKGTNKENKKYIGKKRTREKEGTMKIRKKGLGK